MLRVSSARGNCADAIDWYRQAEELGNDQAAARLGSAYADDNCPQRDLAAAIEWWRKAVDLGARNAARLLSLRLSERGSRQYDPVLALAYAEVAADEPAPSRASSAPPADPVELAAGMTPAQIEDARRIADASRAAIRARTQRFSIEPPQESLLRRETAETTVRISALDDLRECERNLIANCRGVRRLAYADVSNLTDEYLRCSFEISARGAGTLERQTLVSPQTARRLRLGRIAGTPTQDDMRVDCSPLPGFAAAVASGTCIAQPAEAFDLASIYPM
jgi:hypothetical protein